MTNNCRLNKKRYLLNEWPEPVFFIVIPDRMGNGFLYLSESLLVDICLISE